MSVTEELLQNNAAQTSPLNVRRIGGVTMAENHASWSPPITRKPRRYQVYEALASDLSATHIPLMCRRLYGEVCAAYAESFEKGDLPLPPAKGVAVVACMDARLDVHKILGLEEGDAHIIRNAGGVITDDEIRSLTISQRLLGTREVILIHHTDCGMLTFSDDELKAQIHEDVGLKPHFSMESFSDLEEDVRQSVARIQASPFISHKESVRGFVYEVETGRLREVS
jgi:carbonic anhydrase